MVSWFVEPYSTYSYQSLSKGNTYVNTLVIIPDKYLKDEVTGILSIDDEEMKNKIYVALTRATGETYITSRENKIR